LSLLLCTVMMYEDPRDSPLARYTGIQALKQIVEDTKTKLGKSTDGAGGKK
jgi:hypothetical protein